MSKINSPSYGLKSSFDIVAQLNPSELVMLIDGLRSEIVTLQSTINIAKQEAKKVVTLLSYSV